MSVEELTPEERDSWLRALPEWELSREGKAIERAFEFADFAEAFAFMTRIALISRPVSRSSPRSASTIDPSVGCDVLPENASIAASTQSTPAAVAAAHASAAHRNRHCLPQG